MGEYEGADLIVEKLDKHVGSKFPSMFLDFNEAGPQGILVLEYLKGLPELYGDYSEMTPSIRRMLDAFESAILSTASIHGRLRNSFLVKRQMIYEKGMFEQNKQQGSGSIMDMIQNRGNGKGKHDESAFAGMPRY